ncbi:cpna-3, partial [Pristionchus pacificus]
RLRAREHVRKESGKYKKMMRTPSSSTQPRALRVTHDGMSLFGVELSLSFSNFRPLPDSHGIRISVHLKDNASGGFLELSQTDTIFDLPSSSFSQKTTVPYRFDHPQILQFRAERIKDESLLVCGSEGIIEEPLATLVCSPVPHHLQFPTGLLISVQIRIPPSNNDYLRLRFVGEHIKSYNNFALGAYFLVVIVSEQRTYLLYKSEVIRTKEAKWASFRIPIQPLESSGSLQVHVMNDNTNNRDSLIGYFVTSMAQLMKGAGSHNTYMLMNASGARRSEKLLLELKSVERDSGPSFFDVMRSGCDLRPSIGIDFTASNGSPLDPKALHFIHPHAGNPYQDSIIANFSPIHLHMRDQRVSLLGFGAKVGPKLEMNNCFQLDPSSEYVLGLRGVIETYRRASLSLQPFGPTQYADVIYHTSQFAKASVRLNMNAFYLQVIFTDGCSNLSPRVVDALVDASFFPMAVLFVLIGSRIVREKEADNTRVLQNHPLKHSDGRVAPRQVALVLSESTGEDGLALIPLMISQWKNMSEASS